MRVLMTIVLLMATASAFAQNQKPAAKPATGNSTATDSKPQPTPQNILMEHFYRKYLTAVRWNDDQVAKDALYDLIIQNPNNDSLIFTLAYYYHENNKHASALLVSNDLLQRDPKNLTYLELAAVSSENLGVLDRALQYFESLYLLTNDNGTLYKIAFLQYDLKRFNESNTNADILMGKAESDTLKVVFNDAEGKPKEYPMKASLLNLKGMVAQEQGNKEDAKKHFEGALALAADFIPAKQNLAKIK